MKLNKNKRILKSIMYVMIFSLQVVLLVSCKDENNKAHLAIRMTDAPGNYDAVTIDVQGVEIVGSNGNAIMLNAKSGVYNLLDLSNGLDTLIATGDIEPGKISQIRLILGPVNTVTIDSVVYPLQTPSAMQSGLKLQVDQTLEPGVSYSIVLDFDAGRSVVSLGNGGYQLKPVIRTINAAVSGSIKGKISLTGEIVAVSATSNNVTYTTVTNKNGEFVIAGLPAGTYSVTITPVLPLQPVTKTGIVVVVGQSTNTGVLTL